MDQPRGILRNLLVVVCGSAVDILWLVCLSGTGVYEIIPGFAAGLIASIVVSLCSKAPDEAVIALFDRASKPEA